MRARTRRKWTAVTKAAPAPLSLLTSLSRQADEATYACGSGLPGHGTITCVSIDLKQLGEQLRHRGVPLSPEQFIQVADALHEAPFRGGSEADWTLGDPARRQ